MKDALEHFVETELPELLAKARAAERERIAKFLEGIGGNGAARAARESIARVIRAMGDEKP